MKKLLLIGVLALGLTACAANNQVVNTKAMTLTVDAEGKITGLEVYHAPIVQKGWVATLVDGVKGIAGATVPWLAGANIAEQAFDAAKGSSTTTNTTATTTTTNNSSYIEVPTQ